MPADRVVVCALYRFVRLDDYRALRQPLLTTLERHRIRGTLLLAAEGINGTVAGPRAGIDALLRWLRGDERLAAIDTKESLVDEQPFKRTKVKLKREIVTMGVEGIDPRHAVGTYVAPAHWNALIAEPGVLLVDTRNDYEVQVGSFAGAINPGTENFRQFPQWAAEHLDPAVHKRVAMFCTGGIRCEKSTALLKARGFEAVYHLQGGILNYLARVPRAQSRWRGECFVFDDRVTVDHALERGSYRQCNACRMPLSEEALRSEAYCQGVSCPHCIDRHSDEDRRRFAERERQLQLARARGDAHLGAEAATEIARNRARKYGRRRAERERQRAGKG